MDDCKRRKTELHGPVDDASAHQLQHCHNSNDKDQSDEALHSFELMELRDELLVLICSHLPPHYLLSTVSSVSKRLALACEPAFQQECARHRWAQPRRPRGQAALPRCFPFRSLYRQHACRACCTPGEFPVRRTPAGPQVLLLCKHCLGDAGVQQRLTAANLRVDLLGISGKKLINEKSSGGLKHKWMADLVNSYVAETSGRVAGARAGGGAGGRGRGRGRGAGGGRGAAQ